ncbi:hypothetical protein DIPPA_33586 [Diplonema papillatum]|nr:hypothetical protein DIPPA_33586 [Diplonema papillatum]
MRRTLRMMCAQKVVGGPQPASAPTAGAESMAEATSEMPSEYRRQVPSYTEAGLKNPPKPNPMVKAAGNGPLPAEPPQIEWSPSDAWQPPRLRTKAPLNTFKYQYRGGWKLLFDSARMPFFIVALGLGVVQAKIMFADYMYGPPDPEALHAYHDWDNKRPGQWPPNKPGERVYGLRHEIMQ